jgi:hypothetical protein
LDVGSRCVRLRDPADYFWLSILLPGAGQIAQRRFAAAAVQVATVGSYLVASTAIGGGNRLWFALASYLWSAIEAYRHAPAE